MNFSITAGLQDYDAMGTARRLIDGNSHGGEPVNTTGGVMPCSRKGDVCNGIIPNPATLQKSALHMISNPRFIEKLKRY